MFSELDHRAVIVRRFRCDGCGRPMRVLRRAWQYYGRLTRAERTCCTNCEKADVRPRDGERHRVARETRQCVEAARLSRRRRCLFEPLPPASASTRASRCIARHVAIEGGAQRDSASSGDDGEDAPRRGSASNRNARSRTPVGLQPKFAVGAEAHELQPVVVGLAIDQHEVGPDMAIAMVAPLAR